MVATSTQIDAISERQKCKDLWNPGFPINKIGTKSVDVMGDGALLLEPGDEFPWDKLSTCRYCKYLQTIFEFW